MFGFIGLIGLGFLFLAPSAHAASVGFDAPTRAMLGQTLTVLGQTLDQVQSRLNDQANPLPNPAAVSETLGGIENVLVAFDSALGPSLPAVTPGNPSAPQIVNQAPEENIAKSPVMNVPKEGATVAWYLGPKVLWALIPIALILWAIYAYRNRNRVLVTEVKKEEKSETSETEVKAASIQ